MSRRSERTGQLSAEPVESDTGRLLPPPPRPATPPAWYLAPGHAVLRRAPARNGSRKNGPIVNAPAVNGATSNGPTGTGTTATGLAWNGSGSSGSVGFGAGPAVARPDPDTTGQADLDSAHPGHTITRPDDLAQRGSGQADAGLADAGPAGPDQPGSGSTGPGPVGFGGVARGGVANLVGAGVAGASGVVLTWLIARGLGPLHAGAFFTATAAFVLAGGVAKLGAPTSLVYWPARLRARGEAQLLGPCLRIGLRPVAVAAVLLGVALWFAAPLLGALTSRVPGAGHPDAGGTAVRHAGTIAEYADVAGQLRVLALFLPLAVLTDALLAATRGYRAMRPTVMLDKITRSVLQLAAVAALALLATWTVVPVAAFPLAWAAPYLPVAVLAGYQLRRVHLAVAPDVTLAAPRQRRAAVRRLRREFWRFAWPRALATVGQLALQRLDMLLVAAIAGLPAAALYAVSGRFVVLGQFANQALVQAVQPRLAEALSLGDRHRANALYQTATGWLILITWPLYLMVAIFAPLYLGLFGRAYLDGGRIVAVLAMAMLVATGCGMVDIVLSMGGRTSWNLMNVGLALAVTIAVDLALVPRLGALGAAIGLAGALAINNLLPLAQIMVASRIHPFGRGTLTAAALASTCFGLLPLVAVALLGVRPSALVASVLAGGCCYLAGAVALRRPLALDALTALRRPARARPGHGRATTAPGHCPTGTA